MGDGTPGNDWPALIRLVVDLALKKQLRDDLNLFKSNEL